MILACNRGGRIGSVVHEATKHRAQSYCRAPQKSTILNGVGSSIFKIWQFFTWNSNSGRLINKTSCERKLYQGWPPRTLLNKLETHWHRLAAPVCAMAPPTPRR